jgi:lysine 6-dehydrogenase
LKGNVSTVFVLGGGRTGLTAVRDLVASGLERVMVGDVETSRAKELANELGSNRVGVTKVDLTNRESLVSAIKSSKVLINATWYEYNIQVMKAAIEANIHYLDMGGLFHVTRKQMEMDSIAREAGVTAVLGAGESPGMTNIMCAASAKELDAVEEIRIRVGARETTDQKSDRLVFPFAVSTVFDEYSKPPIMFLNGQFQEVECLSGAEEVQFAGPIGKQACHYSIHSEIATLPLSIKGIRTVDFKLGISEDIYRAIKPLVDAGMADMNPIEFRGHRVSPRDFAVAFLTSRASDTEPSRHVGLKTEVLGTRKGKRIRQTRELVGGPSETLRVRNATALLTGIGASVSAQLILAGDVGKTGVMAPESCIPPSKYLNELEKRKIRLTKSEIEL